MSELTAYMTLGFRHIADLNAADHILFLLALAAVYRLREWRSALWVITAFTIGHSVTLALAVTGALSLPTGLIEFLIPATIVATCVENVLAFGEETSERRRRLRAVLAGVFGLVHGAGFANYLKALFVDQIAMPLLGFNLGLEAGQIVILMISAVAFAGLDRVLLAVRRPGPAAFRIRVIGVSVVVALLASKMVVERSVW